MYLSTHLINLFIDSVALRYRGLLRYWNIVTYMCDWRRGLDWWMDLPTSYTHDSELQSVIAPPLISTIHKSAPVNPFPACFVFTSRFQKTSSNSGDSSASRVQVLFSQPPVQNSTQLIASTSRHGPHRKHSSSIVAFVSVAARTCLPSCRPETAAAQITENTVLLLFHACMFRALPSNGRSLQSYCLATGLYATI
jgi:hypothetical protein